MCATPTACPQALAAAVAAGKAAPGAAWAATARSRATPMRSAPRAAAGTLECGMRTLVLRTLPLEHGQDPLGTGDRPQDQLTPVGFTRVSGERLLDMPLPSSRS